MDRSSKNPVHGGLPKTAAGALGGTMLDRALEQWAADATVDEAARARTRRRWLGTQAEESASFVGALLDLAEHGRPVLIDVAGDRVHGLLVGIGGDFVVLRTGTGSGGHDMLVRTSAIDAVRAEPGGVEVVGDRPDLLDVKLAGVLGPLAAERPEVVVRTGGGVAIRGVLRTAGSDVLRIRVEGDPPTPAWVPIDSVAVLAIHP